MNKAQRQSRYYEQKRIKNLLMNVLPEGLVIVNKQHSYSWSLAKYLYRHGVRVSAEVQESSK